MRLDINIDPELLHKQILTMCELEIDSSLSPGQQEHVSGVANLLGEIYDYLKEGDS